MVSFGAEASSARLPTVAAPPRLIPHKTEKEKPLGHGVYLDPKLDADINVHIF